MDIGVARPEDDARRRVEDVVAVQRVAPRPVDGQQRGQHGDVGAHVLRHGVDARLELGPPGQEIDAGDADEGEEQRAHQPALDEAPQGQGEHVEAHVLPENRVGLAEGLPVLVEQQRLPGCPGRRAHEQAQQARPDAQAEDHSGRGQRVFLAEKDRLAAIEGAGQEPVAADDQGRQDQTQHE